MAKGKPNNAKAASQQRASMRQARLDNKKLLKDMKKSEERMMSMSLPEMTPTAAAPTTSLADVEAAGTEVRVANRRKNGLAKTLLAGAGGASAVKSMAAGMTSMAAMNAY
jgi:hypothetical protein